MKVSIIIPVHNDETALRRALSSLTLLQGDFEIVVVNSGSKDRSEAVAREFRVNVISKEHTNLADALNLGVQRARGERVFILRSKDTLKEDGMRNILKAPYEVSFNGQRGLLTLEDMNAPLDLSQMVINREVACRLQFEDYYDDYLLYRFVLKAIAHGYAVGETPLEISTGVDSSFSSRVNRIYSAKNDGELTCILAFRNEGEEVEKTIASLRYTANNVRIMLVDDCSDDGVDYKNIARIYNCDYHRMEKRSGSAGAKHWGGNNCPTEYFCFFDAHMRVHHDDWDVWLLDLIKENPNSILCSRTICMEKKFGVLKHERPSENEKCGISFGCYIRFDGGFAYDPKWTDVCINTDPTCRTTPVACVLGACYAMTKAHWLRIRGFEGLLTYGLEESLMSIKTWLAGGECLVIKDWGVSHLYRKTNISPIKTEEIDSNRLYLIHLFSDINEVPKLEQELKGRMGEGAFAKAKELFSIRGAALDEFRRYFFNHVAERGMAYFLNINHLVTKR